MGRSRFHPHDSQGRDHQILSQGNMIEPEPFNNYNAALKGLMGGMGRLIRLRPESFDTYYPCPQCLRKRFARDVNKVLPRMGSS